MNIRLVSIILPTYNEVDNIVPLITALMKHVRHKKEIIVVDDNSPDGTSQAVASFIKKTKSHGTRLETRYEDRGLTNSIARGIELARGDVIVWMDCDFSHPPEVVPRLLKKIEEGFYVAVASRFAAGGKGKTLTGDHGESQTAVFLSRSLNPILRLLFGRNFGDWTSGFIAAKKDVFKKIVLRGQYGDYFIDLMVKIFARGFRVAEVPFENRPRRYGQSKTGGSIGRYVWLIRVYSQSIGRLVVEKYFFRNI